MSECPECDTEMNIEIAVQDGWNYSNDSHTTRETEVLVCPKCGYEMDEIRGDEYVDRD